MKNYAQNNIQKYLKVSVYILYFKRAEICRVGADMFKTNIYRIMLNPS